MQENSVNRKILIGVVLILLAVFAFNTMNKTTQDTGAMIEVTAAYEATKPLLKSFGKPSFPMLAKDSIEKEGFKVQQVEDPNLEPTNGQILMWIGKDRMELTSASLSGAVYYVRISGPDAELWRSFKGSHTELDENQLFS